MAVLVVILTGIGVGLLLLVAIGFFDEPPASEPVPYEDLATPYVEGLDAAFRIRQAAWDAQQQIYAEAFRHAEDGLGGEP